MNLTVYERIPDPIVAAEKMALPCAQVCGARTKEEGFVIALTCMVEGITPIEFGRKYHIIQGRPTMRADAFLAQFRRAGGRHVVIENSPERAAVKLLWEGQEYEFSLTWAEAQESRWPWKDANNKKAGLKDNWSTPLDRRSMLWARLISSSVKILAPELCSGMYTPEEVTDVVETTHTAAPTPQPVNAVAMLQHHAAAEDEPVEVAAEPVVEVERITAVQMEQLLDLYDLLDISEEDQHAALYRRGVERIDQLTTEQAADMVGKLNAVKARRGL
jgi:hypothetical protein